MRIGTILFSICWIFSLNAITISNNVSKALSSMGAGNLQEAVKLINQAASTNDLLAQYYLAQCYEYGIGVPMDKAKAFGMYRRAAERGLPMAMKDLSRLYSQGIGVYKSPEKASEWNNRFLQKNDNTILPNLLDIYNQGQSYASAVSEPKEEDNNVNLDKHQSTQSIPSAHQAPIPSKAPNVSIHSSSLVSSTAPEPETVIKKSDIDIDIPISNENNSSTFAFVFANEEYQDIANVPHAINDGEIFAEYCNKTLGIPRSNIHLIKNGTLNNIRREVNLMQKIAEAYKGEASFIIYYAGHGLPDEDSRNTYLLPIDGFPSDLSTCYRLNDLYGILGQLPSKRNLIFLDACFSGATRNNDMLTSARGVVLKPREAKPSGNTFVMASAFGDETSYAFDDKQHGLFTYYLLKKIRESKGNLSLDTLFEYVKDNVSKMSIVVNRKPQTPSIYISPNVGDDWKDWQLK